jgi:hypothetical protein
MFLGVFVSFTQYGTLFLKDLHQPEGVLVFSCKFAELSWFF